ncbi:MAG: aldo/keto reductase, partial [Myxococcota bacterium]
MERTRHLGRTGLSVTRLGLGLAALGRPGYITLGRDEDLPSSRTTQALEAHAHAVLDAAYQAGIRTFDAARSYGRAEAFLRSWIERRDFDPGDIVVSSKWGYAYTADWQVNAPVHEAKEHSLQRLLQQWEQSRQLLWEYLDVYQIHSASLESGVLDNAAVLDALRGLKTVHGIRIGLSLTGPAQAD